MPMDNPDYYLRYNKSFSGMSRPAAQAARCDM